MIKVYFNTDPAKVTVYDFDTLFVAYDDPLFCFTVNTNTFRWYGMSLSNFRNNYHEYKNPTRVRSSGAAARSKTHRKV